MDSRIVTHTNDLLADMVNSLQEQRRLLINQLNKIEQLARRHASPASNPGAHALASAIVKICEEK
jgi:hypothetical protein